MNTYTVIWAWEDHYRAASYDTSEDYETFVETHISEFNEKGEQWFVLTQRDQVYIDAIFRLEAGRSIETPAGIYTRVYCKEGFKYSIIRESPFMQYNNVVYRSIGDVMVDYYRYKEEESCLYA